MGGRAAEARGGIERQHQPELAALKRMFRLGRKRKKMGAVSEFPHLEEDNVRTGFAEDGHCQKLLEYCPELWFRALVECGRTWRVSELLNLRVKGVDLAVRTVRLEPGTTKNPEGRTVAMTNAVWVLLTACVHGKRVDDFVFTRPSGKPVRDFRGIIMEIGGWKTRSVFERYAIVDSNDIRNGVKKLEASRESYSSATVDPVATPAVGQQMIS